MQELKVLTSSRPTHYEISQLCGSLTVINLRHKLCHGYKQYNK